MTRFANIQQKVLRLAGFAAAAVIVATIAPAQQANALSPIGPGAAPFTKQSGDNALQQVQFRGHGGGGGGFRGGGGGGGFRGGMGGGFRGGMGGGGFRGGFRGGGYRGGFAGGPRFYGGGARFGGGRFYGGGPRFYGGPRFARYGYGYRPGWRRPFYGPRYGFYRPRYGYGYGYGYGFYRPRFCRVVFTYWGPRRICRPFYRPYWRAYRW